jgi:hypothetical protein
VSQINRRPLISIPYQFRYDPTVPICSSGSDPSVPAEKPSTGSPRSAADEALTPTATATLDVIRRVRIYVCAARGTTSHRPPAGCDAATTAIDTGGPGKSDDLNCHQASELEVALLGGRPLPRQRRRVADSGDRRGSTPNLAEEAFAAASGATELHLLTDGRARPRHGPGARLLTCADTVRYLSSFVTARRRLTAWRRHDLGQGFKREPQPGRLRPTGGQGRRSAKARVTATPY